MKRMRAAVMLCIFCGVLALSMIVYDLIVDSFPDTSVVGFLFLALPAVFGFNPECRDFYSRSYERKVGIVTKMYNEPGGRGVSSKFFIQLDDEDTKYWIYGTNGIRGHRESWGGPRIDDIYFHTGDKVELFYGRRSNAMIWANILESAIAKIVEQMSDEEFEAAFSEENE